MMAIDTKEFYHSTYGVKYEIFDKWMALEILELCGFGLSNKTIANYLSMDIEEVTTLLKQYLDFSGYIEDLDYNPLFVYRKHNHYLDFITNVNVVSSIPSMIRVSFLICCKIETIRKEVEQNVS